MKQAEAEVVPSSSLVELEVEVRVEVGVVTAECSRQSQHKLEASQWLNLCLAWHSSAPACLSTFFNIYLN